MRQLRAFVARLRGLFAGPRADQELDAELASHLEMATAEYVRQGMSPGEALRRARLEAGGITQAAEAVRDQRSLPSLEAIGSDFRYAFRSLRHAPGFTAIVVLTLGLGIGTTTAIFSVVNGVLLKPLPHREGDRLVYLRQSIDGPGGANLAFSVPEVRDLRNGVPSFGALAEYSSWFVPFESEEGSRRLDVGLVTGNFFTVMGLGPALGRLTNPGDDGASVPIVMVLTHELWRDQFGGDAGVIGRAVRLGASSATIIGVLEPAPFFPQRVDAFVNMAVSPHHVSATMIEGRTHRMTEIVGRLAPGTTVAQAGREVAQVHERMRAEHPDAYDAASHPRIAVLPFKVAMGERARPTLWLLMAAAVFVLIISAANVVNLALMRGVRREPELVARAALGAGVARLRRLLLAENLLLALAGGLLGVVLAKGGLGLLVTFARRYSNRAGEIGLDLPVLGFTTLVAVAIAGLVSAVIALPREGTLAAWIAAGARRLAGRGRKHRVQRGLVVAQVAVSVMLLAGAGLLTRTMVRLADVATGLESEQVLTIPVPLLDPSRASAATDAANKVLYDQMKEEARALPGVTMVGLGSTMPLRSSSLDFEIDAENRPLAPNEPRVRAEIRTANPEYFRAAGIPLLQGRGFLSTDQPGGARVVVINRTLAERLFPGTDPVGRRLAMTGDVLRFTPFSGDWRTIVGVVGDTKDGGLDAEPRGAMFLPFAQEFAIDGGLVIRSTGAPADLVTAATRIVRRLAPAVPIENVLTVAQIKDQSVAPRRLNAALVSAFGLLALIIAAVGIGGVLAFSVSARTTEIGIRMSLGANGGRVQRMILREGGGLLALGLGLGVGGALLSARVIEGLLYGVTPNDPVTFAGVAVVMVAIGLAACWVPARRAARVDPATAMKG